MIQPEAQDVDGAITSRRRVLDLLTHAELAMSVKDLSQQSGLHANTVRSQLALLVEMGRVEHIREGRTRPGRPRLLYQAIPAAEPSDPYRALASELAAGSASGGPGMSPGRAAGHRLGRNQLEKAGHPAVVTPDEGIAMAAEGLHVLGFEASTDPLGDRLYLPVCPFVEMAREDRAICRLHQEMLEGFFSEIDAGVTVRQLDIFVKGDLCVAHLDRPDLSPPHGQGNDVADTAGIQEH